MKKIIFSFILMFSLQSFASGSNVCRTEKGKEPKLTLELDFLSTKKGIWLDLSEPELKNFFFDQSTDFKNSDTPGVYYAEKEGIKLDLVLSLKSGTDTEWPAIVHLYGDKVDLLLPLTCSHQ